ncbi:MAG: glycosyltransferase family 39 protein, partial [Candidatus Omnitrophica bacterium]|nr:glycosyltransferase family 39 protein [Candidatus Omnitrophota bacterium]
MKKTNKIIISSAIIAGCILLYLSFKLSALYFFVFLVGLAVYLIAKKSKESPANKRFLMTLVILIFFSRFLLSLFVFSARGSNLSQDEGLYSKKALIKVCNIKGVKNAEKPFSAYFVDYDMTQKKYGYNGYTYLLALFYYVFGYQIQAARLINVILNIVTFLLIFYLAKEIFCSRVAKIASLMFAFFPSVALWSVMIGTDTTTFLGISAYIFSMINMLKRPKLKWLIALIVSYFIVFSVKQHIAFLLIGVTFFTLTVHIFLRLTKKGKLAVLLLLLFLGIITLRSPFMIPAKEKLDYSLRNLITFQHSAAIEDDSGYLIYPMHFYQTTYNVPPVDYGFKDFFKAYVRGMGYAIFSPFPWKIESNLQFMAYPQVVLWY